MKKVIIALLIALIIPCCVFAGRGLFDFTVGVAAQSEYKIDDVLSGTARESFSVDQLSFGADVEMKLAFVAVDGKVMYAPTDKEISGIASANLAIDIFFVRVKAGLGYEYQYNFDTKAFSFGNPNGKSSSFGDFKNACFDITAGVDALIGNLTVGVYGSLPTNTSIGKGNWGELFPNLKDNWKNAKLGLVVGFSLI